MVIECSDVSMCPTHTRRKITITGINNISAGSMQTKMTTMMTRSTTAQRLQIIMLAASGVATAIYS